MIVARAIASTSHADLKLVADVLAFELRDEFGRLDREIAIWLAVLRDDDAREKARRVHADEHLDRSVEPALERLELGGPVGEAEQLRVLARGARAERLVMRRRAAFRREARRFGEQLLELGEQAGFVDDLAVGHREGEQRKDDGGGRETRQGLLLQSLDYHGRRSGRS